jgi:peroxiredoxin
MKTALARTILSWILVVCITTPALSQIPRGNLAPDFKLRNTAKKTVRLSDYEGRPVILVIGTTWCPGCKDQMSELEKISQFLDDKGIPVIDIFIQENAKAVSNYLKGKKLPASFAALLDDGQVHRAYKVYPIPRLLILDGSRRVVQDTLGLDGEELTRILEKLVEQQDPQAPR